MVAKIGRVFLRIILILILTGGAVQLYLLRGSKEQSIQTNNPQVRYQSTPTLLIPGWGGNTWTYQKLINTAQEKNVAQKRMTIWVAPNGHVRIKGNLNRKNSIIQLLYDWNYTPGYQAQTKQLTRVLRILHRQYHVRTLNVVAHSYGGTEWLHAYISSPDIQKNIQFPKVILLGTPVDETFGERTKFTKWLFKKSKDSNFKLMERQIRHTSLVRIGKIYNWMGAKGGRTDGEVPHIQSEMLRSLLQNKRVNYSEYIYPHTNHVQLHQKKQILNDILKTLWYK